MSCYRVTFFKNLLSSDGHPFKCIQRAFDVRRARSADRAVEAAELRYERLHRGHDWTLYADFLELEVDGKKVDYRVESGTRSLGQCPTTTRIAAADDRSVRAFAAEQFR